MCFSHCNCLKFRIKETAAKPENKLNLIYYKLILWIGKQQIMNNLWQKQIFKYFFTIRSLYSALLATLILINSKNILTPVIFYESNINADFVTYYSYKQSQFNDSINDRDNLSNQRERKCG